MNSKALSHLDVKSKQKAAPDLRTRLDIHTCIPGSRAAGNLPGTHGDTQWPWSHATAVRGQWGRASRVKSSTGPAEWELAWQKDLEPARPLQHSWPLSPDLTVTHPHKPLPKRVSPGEELNKGSPHSGAFLKGVITEHKQCCLESTF